MALAGRTPRSFIAALAALTLHACTPTLSAERGEAYLDAMALARRHGHHGRLLEAAEAYGNAAEHAERRVDRDEARYRQAKALARAGQTARAIELLDRVAAGRPPSRRTARALYDAAMLREAAGDHGAAQQRYREVVSRHPGSGLASLALGRILHAYAERDAGDEALAYLRATYPRVRETELGDDVLDAEHRILQGRGDRSGAREVLERIVRHHPYPRGQRWDDSLWRLADMAEADGDARAAIAWLEQMLDAYETTTVAGTYTRPRMSHAAIRIARLYRDRVGDRDAAARAFQRAYDLFPSSLLRDDALVELGELWLDAGEREDGCEALRRAVEEFEVGRARRRAERRLETDCAGRR